MRDTKAACGCDDLSELIENYAGKSSPASPEDMKKALRTMAASEDAERSENPWIKRKHELPVFTLDVIRDGSEKYYNALTDAILAITGGDYGSIDYKGYRIYYTDTPHIRSFSLIDGHKEYSYELSFQCDALSTFCYEKYNSEDERKAFLDPHNEMFRKTIGLLDKEISFLDDGKWIKERKKLNIYDFKDYSPKLLKFEQIEWDVRNKSAAETFSYLMEDAFSRANGIKYTKEDFDIFNDVVRRMVFFADYGKRNYLFRLQGLILYEWRPKTKRDLYIWHCMHEFGQGDLPDILLDNCTLYYFLDDPQGWEAVAYLLPIAALYEMCSDYEPDSVKDNMLKVFDVIPDDGYRERLERLIEEDRAKAEKGEQTDDQTDI